MSIPVHCAHTRLVDPNTLKPNPVNPNRHSAHQIQLLASIIQEQGWRNPVTVSKRSGLIVRGHGRLEAALLIGCDLTRLLSCYRTPAGDRLYIITEHDRSISTILLPEEY